MTCNQAIVWLDDKEARVLRMAEELQHVSTVYATSGESVTRGAPGPGALAAFFHRVARALDAADEILIVGPSDTKSRFAEYLHKDDHALDPRVVGVEDIALPSDPLLAGYAKLYFASGSPRRAGNGSGNHSA